MPIGLYNLYTKFKGFANVQIGGWWRPQTDFTNQCNAISNKFWNDYTAQAEKSQEIKDNLRPFLKSKNIIVKPATGNFGIATLPADYGRYGSTRILYSGNKTFEDKDIEKCDIIITDAERTDEYYSTLKESVAEIIDMQKWGACLQHRTKGPTLENPKVYEIDNQLKVAPRGVSVIVLNYYIKPKDAIFKYSLAPGNIETGSGDYIIYDKDNSTPLEWPETMIDKFILELGLRYGTFTKDQFLTQSAANQKMTA